MNKDQFFEHLGNVVGRKLDADDQCILDVSLKDGMKTPEFIHLRDVPVRIAAGMYGRWLYDKRSKVWIINLDGGVHSCLMSALYNLYNGTFVGMDRAAECYVLEHYGFYVSGVMNMCVPVKADDYSLLPEEEIFNQAKGTLKWRGI